MEEDSSVSAVHSENNLNDDCHYVSLEMNTSNSNKHEDSTRGSRLKNEDQNISKEEPDLNMKQRRNSKSCFETVNPIIIPKENLNNFFTRLASLRRIPTVSQYNEFKEREKESIKTIEEVIKNHKIETNANTAPFLINEISSKIPPNHNKRESALLDVKLNIQEILEDKNNFLLTEYNIVLENSLDCYTPENGMENYISTYVDNGVFNNTETNLNNFNNTEANNISVQLKDDFNTFNQENEDFNHELLQVSPKNSKQVTPEQIKNLMKKINNFPSETTHLKTETQITGKSYLKNVNFAKQGDTALKSPLKKSLGSTSTSNNNLSAFTKSSTRDSVNSTPRYLTKTLPFSNRENKENKENSKISIARNISNVSCVSTTSSVKNKTPVAKKNPMSFITNIKIKNSTVDRNSTKNVNNTRNSISRKKDSIQKLNTLLNTSNKDLNTSITTNKSTNSKINKPPSKKIINVKNRNYAANDMNVIEEYDYSKILHELRAIFGEDMQFFDENNELSNKGLIKGLIKLSHTQDKIIKQNDKNAEKLKNQHKIEISDKDKIIQNLNNDLMLTANDPTHLETGYSSSSSFKNKIKTQTPRKLVTTTAFSSKSSKIIPK